MTMCISSVKVGVDSGADTQQGKLDNHGVQSESTTEEDFEPSKYPPSFFTDERGNLKFVNTIVRFPCLFFFFTMGMCIIIAILQFNTLLATGNPITDDSSEFDIYDVRSIAYDSLKLARKEVADDRKARTEEIQDQLQKEDGKDEKQVRAQERLGDLTYWIFESKEPVGVFGSKGAISVMRDAETMFTEHVDWPSYCMLEYNETDGSSTCSNPFSALNIYYASKWNSTTARRIINAITPENTKLYNSISVCAEYRIFCQYLPPNVTAEHVQWARELNEDIWSMIAHWDGKGKLNRDIDEVTSTIAHIREIVTKSQFVSYFFDEDFNLTNQVSLYSRSIVFWGSPLKKLEEGKNETSGKFRDDEVEQTIRKE